MRDEYSVYEAKAKLSEILRAVAEGREITITHHGRKAARVVPYPAEKAPSLDERINELEARGLISKAKGPLSEMKPLAGKFRPGVLERFLKERE